MRGIVTIHLGGEVRTLSLKNNFLVIIAKQVTTDPLKIHDRLIEIIEENPMRAVVLIVYCGMCAYFERTGNYNHGLTLPQVSEWVDDADETELETVWNEFAQIMELPRASEEQLKAYEESLKKNLMPKAKVDKANQTAQPHRHPAK